MAHIKRITDELYECDGQLVAVPVGLMDGMDDETAKAKLVAIVSEAKDMPGCKAIEGVQP